MKAVVYGGGNIGRGFLGQLLYESGYETVFIDVNQKLIDKLNTDKSYPIKIVCNDYQKEILIKNVRAVHSNDAVDEISTADIIFTSAGVNVLPYIAPALREGIACRKTGVDIIICENLIHADKYLKDLIKPADNIGFVEASVGRMVPVMTDEMREGCLTKVWVEPFCTLPVDKAAFKNPIPELKGMIPSEPFEYYIQTKLYLHNMGHAIAAYLGMKKGYEYIWQAMENDEILETVKNAMYASAMKSAFFDKLGDLTVPENQRNFATKDNLPTYAEKIAKLKEEGAKLVLIFGIGRMCHIAFWEPHFAAEFASVEEWKKQTHRIGAKLHPLTIEQNAITSFKSRTTLVPCTANTVGPGLFLQADYIIGGADGALGRGMGWQGMSFLTTLHYGESMWIPSTFMPTMPGKLFYLNELAGPLVADVN